MKATEYRINNILLYRGVPVIVTELNKDDIKTGYFATSFEYSEQSNDIERLTPVFLSEEWLVRLGFEKSISTNFILGKFRIWIAENENKIFVFYDGSIRLEIQYVHQLQNLYFSLTGEELELK